MAIQTQRRAAVSLLVLLGSVLATAAGGQTIGNLVWYDADADGIQDAGEPGIFGASLRLRTSSETSVATAQTDASGAYSFTGIGAGTYYIELVGGSCWGVVLSPQDQGGSDAADSDFNPATYRTADFVFAGGTVTSYDLGITTQPATVTGKVWFETDFDGIREAGEGGESITVFLRDLNCVGLSFAVASNASGDFTFANYLPAPAAGRRFRLSFSRPGSRYFTKQDQGADDTLDSDADAIGDSPEFPIVAGTAISGIDAGLISSAGGPVTIGNRAFHDADADGIQDVGEVGYGAFPIYLYYGNLNAATSQSVLPDGSYAFSVPPGKYRLEGVSLSCLGVTVSPQDQGGDDAIDSDFTTTSPPRTDFFEVYTGGDLTRDLGIVDAPSMVSGRVFFDADGDGVRDGGEPGIGGVTVHLDATCWGTVASVATDSNGLYVFPAIPPRVGTSQDYRIRFQLPGGYYYTQQDQGGNDTLDSDADTAGYTGYFDAPSGGSVGNVDAGLIPNTIGTVRIGNRAWYDQDADGIQDPGEPGMATAYLRLESENGGSLGNVSPGVDGSYEFSGSSPGFHRIRPYGLTCYGVAFSPKNVGGDDTVDNDFDSSGTDLFSAGVGLNHQWDLGITTTPASLSGRVWRDDGDGIQEAGEPSIAGVPIELRYRSCGGPSVTVYSDANGMFAFPNVMPALNVGRFYDLRVASLSGFSGYAPQNAGGDDSLDSDVNASGATDQFTLAPGQVISNVGIGLTGGTLRSVGDFAWQDLDGDGTQDVGEAGLDGVDVRLLAANAQVLAQTTTASGGAYSFANLAQQTYIVEFVAPVGFVFSLPDQGSDATDSDANPATGRTASFSISGVNDTTRDAGLIPANPAAVGDKVWLDLDADGIQDAGEGGVANVTVTLRTAGNVLVSQTTTSASGIYGFANLQPGDYRLTFGLPAGFVFSPQDQGGDDTADSDPDPLTGQTATFTLAGGSTDATRDAGLIPDALATAGDLVWDDLDRDGIQDLGEPGLANVGVELFTSGGASVGTTMTNGAGIYGFSGLASGDYSVVFTLPALYEFSPANQTGDTLDSDANVVTGQSHTFTLSLGEDETSVDAGMRLADITPPRVSNVDSVASSAGSLGEGEVVSLAITELLVAFDEALDESLAETLASYMLLEAGDDRTLETTACGAPVGDDATVTLDSATYAANSVTLGINSGSPLGDSTYRLFVCAALEDVAGNALDGDGDGTAGDDFTRTFTVDTLPPTVATVSSVASFDDGTIDEGDATNVAVIQLLVELDEPVADPAGHAGADDVTNPANWLLLEAGADTTFETVDCATGAAPTDGSVAIDAVAWDDPSRTATLDVNGGAALGDGRYRLLACGTTSIVDLAGNPLDGDADGTGGDDFARGFVVDATAPGSAAPITSGSHGDGMPKPDATVDVAWSAATDGLSGIDGYSFFFDGTAGSACETTKDVEEGATSASSSSLLDGTWYVHVCTVDQAGNWGPVAHGGPYVVDTVAPSGLMLGSSSHTTASWSNDGTIDFDFSGAVDANGVVGYAIAFDQLATTDPGTTVDQAGTSYQGTAGVDGADWYLHVRACDAAGNCGPVVHLGPFWIDTTAPGDPGAVTSSSHDPGPTNDTTIDVGWGAASDALAGVAGYPHDFSSSASPPSCGDLASSTTGTSASSAALGDGSWYLHVCAVDVAGNASGVVSGGPYVIDLGAPRVAGVDSMVSSGGAIDEGEAVNVAITALLLSFDETMEQAAAETLSNYLLTAAGDDGELDTNGCTLGGDDVAVAIDAVSYAAGTVALGVNGGVALADGDHVLVACPALLDIAGNALDGNADGSGGDAFVRSFTVDTLAPSVMATRIADDGEPLPDGLVSNATVTGILVDFDDLMFDPAGDGDAGDVTNPASYRLVFDPAGAFDTDSCADADPGDDAAVAIDSVGWDGNARAATVAVNGGVDLGDGQYRFFACASLADRAGNPLGAEWMVSFHLDRQAPGLPSLASSTHAPFAWSTLETLGFGWSGAADEAFGSGLSHYALAVDQQATGWPDGSWTVTHGADPHQQSAGPLAGGAWFVHLVACDVAGNCAGPQHAGAYLIDAEGPEPSPPSSSSHGAVPVADATIDVTWPPAVDDASGLAGYGWAFTTAASWSCDQVKDGDEATVAIESPPLADGDWYVHLCALDNAGNWGGVASLGPLAIDATAPQVTAADSVPEARVDGVVVPEVGVAITQLLVTFSEPLAESGSGSVLDAGNWQVVEAGANGVVDTGDCGPLGGDDVVVAIPAVGWDVGSATAAVAVGSGSGLGGGRYRLFACDTLTDPAGNALDGGIGLAAATWSTDLVVVVDPLPTNPNFDADSSAWSLTGPNPGDFSWQAVDGEGKPFSGSVVLDTIAGVGTWRLEQCVEVTASGDYRLRALARIADGSGGEPIVHGGVAWFDAPACGGTNVGEPTGGALVESTGGSWLGLDVPAHMPPAGAMSALAYVEVTSAAASSFTVELDRLFFGLLPSGFSDGFEGGDACQWTVALGAPACP